MLNESTSPEKYFRIRRGDVLQLTYGRFVLCAIPVPRTGLFLARFRGIP